MRVKRLNAPVFTQFSNQSMGKYSKYVALDRDNTLISDAGNTNLDQEPTWLPGVIEGLTLIGSVGFELVVITNQAAVSKGLFSISKLEDFHVSMNSSLKNQTGLEFKSIISCPHSQLDGCVCRKPRPGMFLYAQKAYGNLPEVMIGDSESDMQAARAVGVKGLKVSNGNFLTILSAWLDTK
jgi:D-glycero-D-manno-heptose 1,7-bisphosphate phosphatase